MTTDELLRVYDEAYGDGLRNIEDADHRAALLAVRDAVLEEVAVECEAKAEWSLSRQFEGKLDDMQDTVNLNIRLVATGQSDCAAAIRAKKGKP